MTCLTPKDSDLESDLESESDERNIFRAVQIIDRHLASPCGDGEHNNSCVNYV